MKTICSVTICLGLLLLGSASLKAEDLNPAVVAWLDAQTKIQSWTADLIQTRKLRSLTQPLTKPGKVWFSAPNKFRWELGRPAQTIAVREPDEMLILYPHLHRVERFPLTAQQTGPWRDALALLEAGFPRSRAALEQQYNVVSQNISGDTGKLVLEPKSSAARRMMPHIEIDFDTKQNLLRGTELEFADGSTMRNDFSNIVVNPQIEPQMFSPPIPPDYKVSEPLKHH